MFRIRRVFDDSLPVDRAVVAEAAALLRRQFPDAAPGEFRALAAKLRDPLKHRFRTILFVAETGRRLLACAVLLHVPDLSFCYLDYISAAPGRTGGGVGGALYARLREEAVFLGARGVFMECPPDTPEFCPALRGDKAALRLARARIRFYERFGARVVVDTAFETPLDPSRDDCAPMLVYDPLGSDRPLRRDEARGIVRAILERKYGRRCPPGYVDMVVESFRHDPVRLRPAADERPPLAVPDHSGPRVLLTVNDRHDIHHIHERGYVESPARVRRILAACEGSGIFERIPVREFSERHILAVHDGEMVRYFKRAVSGLPPGKSLYPYVFPIRNQARPPKELPVRAGYYCIDTFTPLNANAYKAAKRAVDCALTAAERLTRGDRLAYALVRPPGHHAEHRAFGGFCYFNTASVAADYLSALGPVAVLDVDYHHGNGTQDIFYRRADVLTVSIHGHPSFAYPYFSGFADERGAGPGLGFNLNLPLPESVDGAAYRKALGKAVARIKRFKPMFLVVSLGLDPAKGDPTGSWSLTPEDFERNGRLIGGLGNRIGRGPGVPILVVQEGGYKTQQLGVNVRRFFTGLRAAAWRGDAEGAGHDSEPGPAHEDPRGERSENGGS